MGIDRATAARAAFELAQTAGEYNKAKRQAGRLDILTQFEMVGAAKAARERLQGQGVRL